MSIMSVGEARILAGLAAMLFVLPVTAGVTVPKVHIDSGQLAGVHDAARGLDEFRGIPYAKPPVGALRWKPPQPVTPWKGVRAADYFGPRCMQSADFVTRSDGVSEDCLYLNVWAPAGRAHKHLPVLVYFYGGGFVAGDGSEYRYDGASLAQRGIVTVTVNYRLGVFGFLALPALAAESPHHATGNYGLLDQAAALRWVHRNIAAFGGNPDAVTIGGESAGAMSVSALMASPLSRGLIARAIGESGSLLGPSGSNGVDYEPRPRAIAEQQGEAFEKRVGAHSLAQLRKMPASMLLTSSEAPGVPMFGVTIDGWFLPRSPITIFQAGKQAHVPLLVGSNSEESFYGALLQGKAPTPANYRAALQRKFGAHAAEALKLYPGRNRAQVMKSGTALASDEFIAYATWLWMHWQRTTGAAPVYYYYFTKAWPAARDGSVGPGAGAVHSGEIVYALGNLHLDRALEWTAADHKVSATTEGYFANFIKSGDPNGPGLPHWPAAAPRDGGLLRQVIGVDTQTIVSRDAPRYEFLQKMHVARRK